MNQAVFTTIAAVGFTVAFFHAAIPTHWLPFVLTARVQHWNRSKTILITAVAGTGHVAVTAVLGFLITWLGTTLSRNVVDWFPRVAGGVLLLLGIYYICRQFLGKGHVHFGYPHEHLHADESHVHPHPPPKTSDRAAIFSLLAFLTCSPCEAFLPIYGYGIRYGWFGFALLTAILSVATVAGMILFTSLTLAGLDRVKLSSLENHESIVMGSLLCLIGVLILFFER